VLVLVLVLLLVLLLLLLLVLVLLLRLTLPYLPPTADFRRDPTPRCGPGCSQVDWQDGQLKDCKDPDSCAQTYSTTVFSKEAVRVVRAQNFTTKPLFLVRARLLLLLLPLAAAAAADTCCRSVSGVPRRARARAGADALHRHVQHQHRRPQAPHLRRHAVRG